MSNLEKTIMVTEEETNEQFSDESDHQWSDYVEGEFREIVLALPALSVSERLNGDDDQVLKKKAIVAAELAIAAVEEATVMTEENTKKTQKTKFDDAVGRASGSVEVIKKPRKEASTQLQSPPEVSPKCNICAEEFLSWKAFSGHLRAHKDRGYLGFFPPSSGGRGLDIDLNADPMENVEDIAGSAPLIDLNRSPPQEDEEEEEE